MAKNILRRCIFRPYRKGMGPTFYLTIWATDRTDKRGQTYIGYQLYQDKQVLFEGADFCGSPLLADDADATVVSLMGFLTLCPGDTDADYFDNYTPEQLDFCEQRAADLALCVSDHFGDL